jgi:hypothetical protein
MWEVYARLFQKLFAKFRNLLPKRPAWEEELIKKITTETPRRLLDENYRTRLGYNDFNLLFEDSLWEGWTLSVLGSSHRFLSSSSKKVIFNHLVKHGFINKKFCVKTLLKWILVGTIVFQSLMYLLLKSGV